jgi:hypothetical protein
MTGDFPVREAASAGRMARCSRCGTAWFARVAGTDDYGSASGKFRLLPARARRPLIIEGEIALAGTPPLRQPPARPERKAPTMMKLPRADRRIVAAFAAGFVLLAAALPAVAALLARDEGFALEAISSRFVGRGDASAIVVEGRLVNHANRAEPVPAIRVSLRTDDDVEIYSWVFEPTTTRLDAGGSIGFRSALATPLPDAGKIAVALADRQARADGTR